MSGIRTTKTKLRKNAKRRQSSTQWLHRQLNDPYVQQARLDGYRARSAYKLAEIDEKYGLIKRDMRVLDLGAAPGSWSQYLANKGAKTVAVDILEMDSITGVQIIQGDFLEDEVQRSTIAALNGAPDLILSDIAPSSTGRRLVDRLRAESIGEAVLEFAHNHLSETGSVLLKLVKGAEAALQDRTRDQVRRTRLIKPKATRDASSEIYMLADTPRR